MTLTLGDRLRPYRILSALGAGGMDEVRRANDNVAGARGRRPDLRGAIQPSLRRWGRVVAALNRPNIGILHDVGLNYL